ncbi:hypothetical protein, partial [Shigella flexneri]|uniref:hypothetical protein n=1 Tax=Shigella flexneri TaxID=623 RepID=UPI003FA73EF8
KLSVMNLIQELKPLSLFNVLYYKVPSLPRRGLGRGFLPHVNRQLLSKLFLALKHEGNQYRFLTFLSYQ